MKLTEANIWELYTTEGKDVWEFTGIENKPVYCFNDLKGNQIVKFTEDDMPAFRRLIPEPRKYERKSVITDDIGPVIEFNEAELKSGGSEIFIVKEKRTRKPKENTSKLDIENLCSTCALYSNCDQVANLKPNGSCESYSKK